MVQRGNRIKEVRFASQTFSANGADATVYSDESINGEILDVQWNFNRSGSVFLTTSGTSLEFFRRNAPSGAAWQQSAPYRFSESTTGSIANADHVPFVVQEKIVLNVNNAASGAAALDVVVKYR